MYVITITKSIQTIMTITANAVITAMMVITAITDIIGPLQLVLALEAILCNTTATANREIYVITVTKSIQNNYDHYSQCSYDGHYSL